MILRRTGYIKPAESSGQMCQLSANWEGNVTYKTVVLGGIMALVLLLSACGEKGEDAKAGEDLTGNNQGPTISVKSNLPDDFPGDVPVYPDMKVIFAAKVGSGYKVRAVTSDDVATVDAFFKEHLADQDWARDENQMSLDTPQGKAYQYNKGKKIVVVKIVGNKIETTVEMTYLDSGA